MILASLVEERSGKVFDKNYLVRKLLFSLFFTTTHSDINHDVKEFMKRTNPTLYQTLRADTYKKILELPMHEVFRADIYSTMLSDGDSETDVLIEYAKLYANLIEARSNARVYPEVYSRQMAQISERMDMEKYKIFQDFLPHRGESEVHFFLMTIRRLQSTKRWNLDRRTYPVSVMSHLVFVLFFTYIFCLDQGLDKYVTTDAMITALYHDVPEGLTWDIITPTKEALPEIRTLLETIETEMVDRELLSFIRFSPIHFDVKSRILTPWKMPSGSLIKLADHYSALYEAKIEIPTHPEMQEVYDRIFEIIQKKQKEISYA